MSQDAGRAPGGGGHPASGAGGALELCGDGICELVTLVRLDGPRGQAGSGAWVCARCSGCWTDKMAPGGRVLCTGPPRSFLCAFQ